MTLLLCVALLLFPLPGVGLQDATQGLLTREVPFEYEAPAGYGGGLKLMAGSKGSVQVSAWQKATMVIEARIELHAPSEADLDRLEEAVSVSIEENPTGIDIFTTGPHDRKSMKGIKKFPGRLKSMPYTVDYVIWVPEYTAVDLTVLDGETTIDGVNGVHVIKSTFGPVRVSNVSGAALVSALDGEVEINMSSKSWRGVGIDATAGRGNVSLNVPTGFSANLFATAFEGVTVGEKPVKDKLAAKMRLGDGGSIIKLSAPAGKAVVHYTDAPPPEPEEEETEETPEKPGEETP